MAGCLHFAEKQQAFYKHAALPSCSCLADSPSCERLVFLVSAERVGRWQGRTHPLLITFDCTTAPQHCNINKSGIHLDFSKSSFKQQLFFFPHHILPINASLSACTYFYFQVVSQTGSGYFPKPPFPLYPGYRQLKYSDLPLDGDTVHESLH